MVELGEFVAGERDLENGAGTPSARATKGEKRGATAGDGGASVCYVGGEALDGDIGEHRASVHNHEAAVDHEEHTGQDGS